MFKILITLICILMASIFAAIGSVEIILRGEFNTADLFFLSYASLIGATITHSLGKSNKE